MRIRNNNNADNELSLCEKYIETQEELQEILKEKNQTCEVLNTEQRVKN